RGDPRDQAAAADRDEHGVRRLRRLPHDLHAYCSLSRDHVRIVVGVDEGELAGALEALRLRVRLVVGVAVQHHLGAARLDRVDLGRGRRHHDGRGAAELLRGERHALGVVAGRGRDHPARKRRRGQVHHLVVRAAALEREHRLHVLALEEHPVAEPRRQVGRDLERRLDRHVVDARREDPLEIVVFHHFAIPPNGGSLISRFPVKGATVHEVLTSRGECAPRGWPMAKRSAKKAKQAFWERGYLSHSYWYGKERLGTVELGAKKDWDGVYRWRSGNHAGEAGSLEEAKRAVEQAALIGASQLKLFDRNYAAVSLAYSR